MKPLRLVFMGTPEFSVPTLQALIKSSHSVVAVYTQPPKPAGRGYKMTKSPIQQLAEQHHIPVETPPSFKNPSEQDRFAAYHPDLAVVVAYGLILPRKVLSTPPLGCINLHASLLPRWRGASPIQHALLAGDPETGITVMQMEEGLDTGPILAQESLALTPDMTASSLHDALSHLAAEIFMETLPAIAPKALHPIPQSPEGVTYAPRLTRDMGRLDWSKSAEVLECQIRALTPWPGCWFLWNDMRLKVWQARVIEEDFEEAPGSLVDSTFIIACGAGALRIEQLQKPGGTIMTAQEFLNGHPLVQKGKTCFS